MTAARELVLRKEVNGADQRHLWAYVDEHGNLHVDGQDLGPGTSSVSEDGEYEWFTEIRAADVPRLVVALGGAAGDDVLALLEARYRDAGSYELERVISSRVVPFNRRVWSG